MQDTLQLPGRLCSDLLIFASILTVFTGVGTGAPIEQEIRGAPTAGPAGAGDRQGDGDTGENDTGNVIYFSILF